MRIYNEVVLQWDDKTQQFNTIYEDSENYDGPVLLAQGAPPMSTAISAQDTIADTIKTTAGYFTGGDGTLSGNQIHTSSLTNSNEKYYFSVMQKHPTSASAETQFSVTFGHILGSGSDQYGDTTDDPTAIVGETKAIYKQFTHLLLEETEMSGGFKISANGSSGVYGTSKVKDEYFYALVGKRERFKDRLNKKAWTLRLSGSNSTGSGVSLLLTDDSNTVPSVATPGGPRHNIVSGTLGVPHTPALTRTYGWFYPDRGVMLFSGVELSASIPGGPNFQGTYAHTGSVPNAGQLATGLISCSNGSPFFSGSGCTFVTDGLKSGDMVKIVSQSAGGGIEYQQTLQVSGSVGETAFSASTNWAGASCGNHINSNSGSFYQIGEPTTNITASFSPYNYSGGSLGARASASGFAPNIDANRNSNNALRLINCMANVNGNTLQLRSEEDATQENYFCRIRANDYNFSANPTFVSGSLNKLRHIRMYGNPQTFITGIGLYNSAGQLLAIAELSKPLKKNFASEATIKVKLTY